MDGIVSQLQVRLKQLRDWGLQFLNGAERNMKQTLGHSYDPSFNSSWYSASAAELWSNLSQGEREIGDTLRHDIRALMTEVAAVAHGGILVDAADLQELTRNTKRMAASMRLQKFTAWGVQIHHD